MFILSDHISAVLLCKPVVFANVNGALESHTASPNGFLFKMRKKKWFCFNSASEDKNSK